MQRILNYGSLNLDLVYAVPHTVTGGETVSSTERAVHLGGKGLNQSIAAARAGACVFHAGKIGADGTALRDALRENGVDVSFLRVGEGQTGHAVIQVEPNGQNAILLFSGCNRKQTVSEITQTLSHFGKGDILLLQNECNLLPELVRCGAENGMHVVLNPSPITPDLQDVPMECVSLLVLNEVEGEALSGKTDPREMLHALREAHPSLSVLLSLGSRGALYADGTCTCSHGIYQTDVKDTTGAGDTLTGFFVATYRELGAEEALRLASRASAIAVSRFGASPSVPTRAEAEALRATYIPFS